MIDQINPKRIHCYLFNLSPLIVGLNNEAHYFILRLKFHIKRLLDSTNQSDIAKALRAVKQIGLPIALEILPDGAIRIVPHQPNKTEKGWWAHELDGKPRPIM